MRGAGLLEMTFPETKKATLTLGRLSHPGAILREPKEACPSRLRTLLSLLAHSPRKTPARSSPAHPTAAPKPAPNAAFLFLRLVQKGGPPRPRSAPSRPPTAAPDLAEAHKGATPDPPPPLGAPMAIRSSRRAAAEPPKPKKKTVERGVFPRSGWETHCCGPPRNTAQCSRAQHRTPCGLPL